MPVHTRSNTNGGNNGQSNNNNNDQSGTNANPPPPGNQPMTIEQLMTMQTQLMQGMAHIMNHM